MYAFFSRKLHCGLDIFIGVLWKILFHLMCVMLHILTSFTSMRYWDGFTKLCSLQMNQIVIPKNRTPFTCFLQYFLCIAFYLFSMPQMKHMKSESIKICYIKKNKKRRFRPEIEHYKISKVLYNLFVRVYSTSPIECSV